MTDAKVIVIASDARGLDSIVDLIHDKWFGLSRVSESGDRVTIPITGQSDLRKAPAGSEELELVIGRVRAGTLRVCDDAHIEWYDINELSYAPHTGEIRLSSGFPLLVCVAVDAVNVELRRADARPA